MSDVPCRCARLLLIIDSSTFCILVTVVRYDTVIIVITVSIALLIPRVGKTCRFES